MVIACGGASSVVPEADASSDVGVEGAADPDANDGLDDGGPAPMPDLSTSGDDAGPDGGPCNTVVNLAPAVTSTCVSALPTFAGGPLVAGTYHLVAVTAIASKAQCGRFTPVTFRETLDLTVDPTGVGTAETVTRIATTGAKHRTTKLAPGASNSSPLTATPICPADVAGSVRYGSALTPAAKQELVVVLPYGVGTGVYHFEKQ
jgi:hypothetical protein